MCERRKREGVSFWDLDVMWVLLRTDLSSVMIIPRHGLNFLSYLAISRSGEEEKPLLWLMGMGRCQMGFGSNPPILQSSLICSHIQDPAFSLPAPEPPSEQPGTQHEGPGQRSEVNWTDEKGKISNFPPRNPPVRSPKDSKKPPFFQEPCNLGPNVLLTESLWESSFFSSWIPSRETWQGNKKERAVDPVNCNIFPQT